jgi:hypothetical protein
MMQGAERRFFRAISAPRANDRTGGHRDCGGGIMKLLVYSAAFLTACAATASAQVDQKRIDQAIKKGVEWLKTAPSPPHEHSGAKHSDELILLTMIHAEVSESNPRFKELLKTVLEDPLAQTYKVALQAMCLEELDRVKYQLRIAQCAQFLVDNMCTNGQWSYGKPTTYKDIPPQPPDVQSGPVKKPGPIDFSATKVKPKVTRRIPIKAQRDGGEGGDNSNTQYGALGLRACFDAGITFEEQLIVRAAKWWMECQGPPEDGAAANAVQSGGDARPRGWNYKMAGADGEAYGSMTAGGVGSVVIYDYMLKKDWKKNPIANAGVSWLNLKWDVKANPGKGGAWHYYYLYGLERAGILYDTTLIGKHDWYLEGARLLLDAQDGNGSWQTQTWDTCFAILFLKKATRPLIATGPERK